MLAAGFCPPISEYHKAEQALAMIDDVARLSDLLRHTLHVADLAPFLRELGASPESAD